MKRSLTIFVFLTVLISSTSVTFGQKLKTAAFGKRVIKVEAAVEIAQPEAFTDGNGVFVRWHTVRESGNLGFYVYRTDKGVREAVENRFVTGGEIKYKGQTLTNEDYSLFDPDGTAQSQYVVVAFEKNGNRTSANAIFPSYISDLSKVVGEEASDLYRRKRENNSLIAGSDLVLTKELLAEVNDHQQLADPGNQRWVAAQAGARIGVKRTGMYRVTRAQLQTAGFDVNSDPTNWQLYTDGVEQSIIVGPNADYIDFYGRGIDTIEADTRVYYLLVGPQPGRRMATLGLRPSLTTVKAQSYETTVSLKERLTYLPELLNGDADNFVGHLYGNFASPTNISLTAVDTAAASVRVTMSVLGFSGTPHTVDVSLNGHVIGQMTGLGVQQMSLDVNVPTSYLVEGNNSFDLLTTNGADYGFFDQVQITYRRRHVADQNRISFTTQNYRGAKVEGFSSSNVRLFDITYDGDPVQLTGPSVTSGIGGFDLNVPAYRGRVMFAVEDSGLLTPASVTLNTPSSLSTSAHNGKLVIISYRDFLTQANSWADYRRGQGDTVEVVNVEDVFDEFNYGVLSANSMRDFLNFAEQNWATPPQYVLLVGDGSYDPKNFEGNGSWDLIPVKFFDSAYDENPSDDAIVDFNNDGFAEMAIGRIPARNSAMVTNALNKTISFEANITPQNISRGFTCNYDNPSGWDFQAMCNRLAAELPAGTTSVMIGRADTNPNAALISELNNGRFLVNFSGHGLTGSWSSAANFNIAHVPSLTNINGLSIYTMLTCLNGYFAGGNVSMAEALLNSTTGGAVAAWASTGTTTPDIQETMGKRFYNQVGAGTFTRLGDLIIDAKTVVPGGRDVRDSWVLLGDPMLKVR